MDNSILKLDRTITHPRDEVIRGEHIQEQEQIGRTIVVLLTSEEYATLLQKRGGDNWNDDALVPA